MTLDSKIPEGPLEKKWDKHRFDMKLVNPANKRQATRSWWWARALPARPPRRSLGELGYSVKVFCFQDSPSTRAQHRRAGRHQRRQELSERRRQHYRLFYDTIKGGDFRSREANVYRLAAGVSNDIIDQCVAQGVPFAREYGGLPRQPIFRRRAGVPHVLRARADRPAAAARRLLGADAPDQAATVKLYPRTEMLDLVLDRRPGKAASLSRPGHRRRSESHVGDAVVLAPAATRTSSTFRPTPRAATSPPSGGPTKRARSSPTPASRRSTRPASRRRRLPVEADAHVGISAQRRPIWVPKNKEDKRAPDDIPEADRDYYLERKYPRFGNLAPRDISSRAAKEVCDDGPRRRAPAEAASTSTSPTPSSVLART